MNRWYFVIWLQGLIFILGVWIYELKGEDVSQPSLEKAGSHQESGTNRERLDPLKEGKPSSVSPSLHESTSKGRERKLITKEEIVESNKINSYWAWRYLLATGIMAGVLLLFWWSLKKLQHRVGGGKGYGSLEVLQRVVIDSQHSLVRVRYHEDELLIGISPKGMELLTKLARIEETPELSEGKEEEDVPPSIQGSSSLKSMPSSATPFSPTSSPEHKNPPYIPEKPRT